MTWGNQPWICPVSYGDYPDDKCYEFHEFRCKGVQGICKLFGNDDESTSGSIIWKEDTMTTRHKGNMIRDIPEGEMLKNVVHEGDLLVSEAPKGDPLWKKKKKLNEEETEGRNLNETYCACCK